MVDVYEYGIDFKDRTLIGSDVYFSGSSFMSNVVRFGGLFDWKRGAWKLAKWTHVGTIVWNEGQKLGLLEALVPKVVITDLEQALTESDNKMCLCILSKTSRRTLDKNMFSFNEVVKKHEGQPYNKLFAGISGVDIFPDSWTWFHNAKSKVLNKLNIKAEHCSYITALTKTMTNIISPFSYIPNEMTPDDCFYMKDRDGRSIYEKVIVIK